MGVEKTETQDTIGYARGNIGVGRRGARRPRRIEGSLKKLETVQEAILDYAYAAPSTSCQHGFDQRYPISKTTCHTKWLRFLISCTVLYYG